MDIRSAAKGAAVGAAAGLAYYAFSKAGPIQKVCLKRDADRTLKAAGSLLSDIKSVIM